jgi:transcriptional regulator with XRE-family HTH domain
MESNPKVGPVGKRLAANVRALRTITVRDLSLYLTELGRPISASGITKLEQESRRVDVDDLAALAIALDVTPNRLLLDPESDDAMVSLTDEVEVTRKESWQWATGDEPLPEPETEIPHYDADRRALFQRENRPHQPDSEIRASELRDLMEVMAPVVDAVMAVTDDGQVTSQQVVEYLSVWRMMVDPRPPQAKKTTKKTPKHTTSKRKGS